MADRIAHFTTSLRSQTRLVRLGPAPALVALPEGEGPFPAILWLHGRSVSKEIDSARYLRLIRAGIAVAAIDLPGHGERVEPELQAPGGLPRLLQATLDEVDEVVAALLDGEEVGGRIDRARLAMGGMSAGGMVTLRRLCDPHPFRCAVVESTSGDFAASARSVEDRFLTAKLAGLDPAQHLGGWRPLPLLALHSEQDEVAPLVGITRFVEALRARYAALGADAPVVLQTWPETGAPSEHAGFGRKAGEARRILVEFLERHLVERGPRG